MANKPTYEELEQRVKRLEKESFEHKQSEKVLKENELKLRVSEQELNSILHHSPDIIYRLNPAGEITYINDIVKEYNYSREDLIGKNILEFVHPDDREKAVHRINERRTDDRSTKSLEIRLFRKDLDCVPFEDKSRGFGDFSIDAEGIYSSEKQEMKSFVGTQGIARDITERKQAEEALQEGEERQRSLIEAVSRAGILLFVVDSEYKVRYMNEPMIAGVGDATGRICYLEVGGLDSPCEYCQVSKVIGDGERVHYQPTVADGRTFDIIAVPYTDIDGTRCKLEIIQDVTSQMQAQEALRESEEKYRSLITNIPDATWTTDSEGKTLFCSPNVEDVFGYTQDEIYEGGNNVLPERIHPEDAGKVKEAFEKLFEHGTTFDVEYRIKRKDGGWIWAHDRSIAIYERDGMKYADGIFSNITSRKQAEQQKELKIRILDTINQAVNWKESIEDILNSIKEFSGFEAVAIRLREGEDFPYYVTQGFPAHFVEAERYLCSRDSKGEITRDSEGNPYVECMCGNVICGRTDQEKDFFTKGGSFWSNNTSNLLSETTDEDRQTRTRNRCNSEGYESVALIPLKAGNQIVGLIQLNDRRTHRFTDDTILFFEDIGISIGTAFWRKMAEEALQNEKLLSEEYINSLPGLFYVFDEKRFVRWNSEWNRITGYSDEKLSGMYGTDFFEGEDRTLIRNRMLKVFREGAGEAEAKLVTKDGRRFPYYFSGLRKRLRGKEHLIGLGIDITRRKQAEEGLKRAHDNLEMQVEERTAELTKTNKALHESEVRFRTIYENAPALISAFEKNGRCILWNKECEKVFGWTMEEINSHDNPLSLLYPDPSIQKKAMESVTIEPDAVFKEWHPLTKYGSQLITIWANFQLPDGAIINLGYDVTENKLLEDQMIRSERLAATGQLAASIAHEINSPLQGITILLNSIASSHKGDEKLLENLDLVKGGFVNIRDIVKKLLDLNRPGKENKQTMNINGVIEDTAMLLENYLKKCKVKIFLNLSSKVPDITASPQQLGQVFINLVNNAVEAMMGASESKDGGKSGEITHRTITINTNRKKNNIIIEVADTGPGISKEDLEHIFDPFYTRKKKMGMGIGLSICHGIIEDHNGTIAAINSPERGTVFTITLPIENKP